MAFPTDIIAVPNYIDKGTTVTTTGVSLTTTGADYNTCTLAYRARGRVTQADGTVFASSISVKRGGDVFTEVFALPVPNGKYFFHQEDLVTETSTLYFNKAQVDPVDVVFETRGSIIKAATINTIQTDLRTVETILGGTSGVKAMYPGTVDLNAAPATIAIPYTGVITNIVPLAITNTGAALTTTVNLTAPCSVEFDTVAQNETVYYLILIL